MMLEKNISQTDIAFNLNVTKSSISHWINGTNLPSGKALIKLADMFGVSPSSLFIESEISNNSFIAHEEAILIKAFRMLSPKGKEKALERMEELKSLYWYDR